MRQFRGCSHLVYAVETENAETGAVTYGTVKVLAPVKNVSRDIASDNEKVYADNVVQQTTYGATSITRTFETTRIAPDVMAELMGDSTITLGEGTSALSARATTPDGSTRPYIAVGYALYDGDASQPCELVWAYHGKVNSISKSSATIDDGTASEGQSVEIDFAAPKKAWTTTGKRNLDFVLTVPSGDTSLLTTFFAQVVTPDNAASVLTPTTPAQTPVE
jgi:hypothetical protein